VFYGLSNGTARIWMSMSRVCCQNVSQKYIKIQNASYATIVTGFVVAVPALFLNLTLVTVCVVLVFAFVLVCAGVLVLQNKTDIPRGKFKPLC
jgi:amino acid transporter